MIKKIILKRATQSIINRSKLRKFVAKGGKIQKIKAQKSAPVFKNVEAQAAQTKFVQKFGENPGFGSGRGLRIEEASELGAKELAASTARAKWNKQITKFVTRKRSTLASRVKTWRNKNLASGQVTASAFKTREASANYPLIKRSIKKAKIKEYDKALGSADTTAKNIYQKTLTMFTSKSGADPLKHKLVDTKFITTKKYRKGKPRGVSERDLLWAPRGPQGESFARVSGAAHYERQRRSDWFKKPEVIEALAKGKTTKSKVYGAWLKDEAKRRREFAQSFIKTTKKKK